VYNVHERLLNAGYINKRDVWAHYQLSENTLLDRTSTCDSLMKHNERESLLKHLVIEDKNELCTTTIQVERLRMSEVIHQESHLKQIFIKRRLYCMFDGTEREPGTMDSS